MIIAILALAIGLLLIFLEFYLPGAILGITGGAIVIFSIIYFAFYASHPLWVLLFILIVFVLLILLIKITLWHIRKAKPDRSIYLHKDQEGYIASSFQKELIGQKGIAASDLKPSGHVRIGNTTYQAVSKTGYITKGAEVKVISGEGAHLIVNLVNGANKE